MKTRFEHFFKQRKGLAYIVLFSCIFLLVFVIPKIFFSLDSAGKKFFWATFIPTAGIFIYLLYPRQKKKTSSEEKVESPPMMILSMP